MGTAGAMYSATRCVAEDEKCHQKISYWLRSHIDEDMILSLLFLGFGNQVIVLKLRKKRGKMCYEHICGRGCTWNSHFRERGLQKTISVGGLGLQKYKIQDNAKTRK